MDKQLLKAYIRTVVEEEVQRILPKLLSEAVSDIKNLKENSQPLANKPKIDRSSLMQMMDIDYDGFTLTANTSNLPAPGANGIPNPPASQVDPKVIEKLTGNYSAHMKKLGL